MDVWTVVNIVNITHLEQGSVSLVQQGSRTDEYLSKNEVLNFAAAYRCTSYSRRTRTERIL